MPIIRVNENGVNYLFGSSLNYVGESRQRIWPLFLCVSVVGSEHSVSPHRRKDTENFRFKFTHNKQRGAIYFVYIHRKM